LGESKLAEDSYSKQIPLSSEKKDKLTTIFLTTVSDLKEIGFGKAIALIKQIPQICRLHFHSLENRKMRQEHPKKFHPVRPIRGQIFNAFITENVGSELAGNHLVVIMQNDTGNTFGEKVNVLPIEGDGNKINPKFHVKLTNDDLEFGNLDKNPSRVIITDILTLDKSRLDIRIGKIKTEKMKEISNLLRKQLDL
jgi:mRNA-degrading endonuclease toxin of MazEF toxin-antitoxin module